MSEEEASPSVGCSFLPFLTHTEDTEPEEAVERAESVDTDRPRLECPEPRVEGGSSSSLRMRLCLYEVGRLDYLSGSKAHSFSILDKIK